MKKILVFLILLIGVVFVLLSCEDAEVTTSEEARTDGSTDISSTAFLTTAPDTTEAEPIALDYQCEIVSRPWIDLNDDDAPYKVIRSVGALNAYYEELHISGSFSNDNDMIDAKARYDSEFFDAHMLVVIARSDGTTSLSYRVMSVSLVGGDLAVALEITVSETVQWMTDSTFVFLTLDKATVFEGVSVTTETTVATTTPPDSGEEVPISDYTHQMVRFSGGTAVNDNKIWVIRSVAELDAVYRELGVNTEPEDDSLLFEYEVKLLEAREAYDDAFFETHTLSVILFCSPTTSASYRLDGVTVTGSDLKAKITRTVPQLQNQASGSYFVFLALDKAVTVETVSVTVTEVQESAD
ncbi:MAG: hypothetical protein IJW46_01455 [Clostridia bacterium]|nr:hypothetical protein [Clostridia bacterium]